MADLAGILSTASDNKGAYAKSNLRRQTYMAYPQGKFPIAGLLSMTKSTSVNITNPAWQEEREQLLEVTSAQANSAGPFTDTSGSSGAVGTDLTAAGFTFTAGTTYRVKLASVTLVRERDVVWFRNLAGTASSTKQVKVRVTAKYPAQNTIDFVPLATVANVLNTTANNGKVFKLIGSSVSEGSSYRSGGASFPIEVTNYTQIARTGIGPFTIEALHQPEKFSKQPGYQKVAKSSLRRHLTLLEKSLFDGIRSSTTTTNDDGDTVPIRTTGGVKWFLEQWEKGNTGNGGAFDYRVGGSDISASAWETTDDKRIIDVDGSMTGEQWEMLQERLFRHCSDTGNEKIGVCGGKFLSAFNIWAKNQGIAQRKLSESGKLGCDFYGYETGHGMIWLKTHPLLSADTAFQNDCIFLDLGDIEYHPFKNMDTRIWPCVQANDYAGRKDDIITEYMWEIRFPEGHMYLQNVTSIVG